MHRVMFLPKETVLTVADLADKIRLVNTLQYIYKFISKIKLNFHCLPCYSFKKLSTYLANIAVCIGLLYRREHSVNG